MKTVLTFIMMAAIILPVAGQKKEFKENTLKEISGLVENAYEFLDRPAADILAAGRPSSIQGGSKWEIAEVDTLEKNISSPGGAIVIGTGCGALTLMISDTTKLIEAFFYMAYKDARIRKQDLINAFKDKYSFNNGSDAIIEIKDSKKLGVSVANNIILVAKVS